MSKSGEFQKGRFVSNERRKEKLDGYLRKSFELMGTLRCSADQIAQLKPLPARASQNRQNSKDEKTVQNALMEIKNNSLLNSFSLQNRIAIPKEFNSNRFLETDKPEIMKQGYQSNSQRIANQIKQREFSDSKQKYISCQTKDDSLN